MPQIPVNRAEPREPRPVSGARRLLARLRRPWHSEAPPSAATWNAQYEAGRWAYLGQLPELARFSVLIGYMTHFKPGGSILDIGCGEGVLYERMQAHGYSRYVGVDLSSSAIAKIRARDDRSAFFAADGEQYVPDGKFEITVFNEVLGYFHDPQAVVRRYARNLQTDGIILVSTCTAFKGGTGILDGLKRTLRVLDETRVTHQDNPWSWLITALQP
jgi:2-polyprenyl-3-methyl-5-hydroxy-6-metoxy-1,4-benzoquinol methylase